jgi:hypothetical protein
MALLSTSNQPWICILIYQEQSGHGKIQALVDYMGHNKLGGNTMLFIVDGIWAGKKLGGLR